MNGWSDLPDARLALLVDPDRESAQAIRPLLSGHGIELVRARAGVAGLELLQRMPDRFVLAIVNLDLPDLSGAAIIETMRHFLPALPVICLTGSKQTPAEINASVCLPTPIREADLQAHIDRILGGASQPINIATFAPNAIARAKAAYAINGNLLDASREIARGLALDMNGEA